MTFPEKSLRCIIKTSYILKKTGILYDDSHFYLSKTKRATFTFPSISVAAILNPHFFKASSIGRALAMSDKFLERDLLLCNNP